MSSAGIRLWQYFDNNSEPQVNVELFKEQRSVEDL